MGSLYVTQGAPGSLCAPRIRSARKGSAQEGPRQAPKLLPRAGKSGGGPPPLGVPRADLAAGVGALRLTGAASMSYKVPL